MKAGRNINAVFFPILLFIVLCFLAWLSMQNVIVKDLTANGRLSISKPSQLLLEKMTEPIKIDVFVNRSDQLGKQAALLTERYRQIKKDIQVNFISPEENPDLVREHGISFPAEMLIKYRDQVEHLQKPSETAITNALARLLRGDQRWLIFLSGHGERNPLGEANFDLKTFTQEMEKRGLKSQPLNLSETQVIPSNTAALIIASPQEDLSATEWILIKDYLQQGGNLLWTVEPDKTEIFVPLKVFLGLDFLPGTIVDADGEKFKITQPDLIPISRYPDHITSKDFRLTTLLPIATGIVEKKEEGPGIRWNYAPLMLSSENSWNEKSPVKDEIRPDADHETIGPLTLAMALTPIDATGRKKRQRIVVVGDGDFISNTYIGNGGNLDLGIRLFNWVSADDQMIDIPSRPATDLDFELSKTASAIIGVGFLIVLPLIFLLVAGILWWRRRAM